MRRVTPAKLLKMRAKEMKTERNGAKQMASSLHHFVARARVLPGGTEAYARITLCFANKHVEISVALKCLKCTTLVGFSSSKNSAETLGFVTYLTFFGLNCTNFLKFVL